MSERSDMELSLKETATLLGKTQRQIRYMIQQGNLKATKQGGRWVVASVDLPLSEAQRRAGAARAEKIRDVVQTATAPAVAAGEKAGRARYSVRDLRPFSSAEAAYREICAQIGPTDPAAAAVREALTILSQGCHMYYPREKAQRYGTARERIAAAVASLLVDGPAGDESRRALADRLEQQVLPDITGVIRYTEKSSRRDRFGRFGT